jgi:hypothetical protein
MMWRNWFSLWQRTSLCQKLPSDFEEKLLAVQKHVIGPWKANNYLLSQIGNADETPVYFDMSSNYTVDDKGVKSVLIKTSGNEKMGLTVMLTVLADGKKLPPYLIYNWKTVPKKQLPIGLIVRCRSNGWMTNELVRD